MSEHDSKLASRNIFISPGNVAWVNGRLKLRGPKRVRWQQMAGWFDAYMTQWRVDRDKIENVITWVQFMNENYIREYRGFHALETNDIPFMPWNEDGPRNKDLISHTAKSGKFPRLKLESAVEDRIGVNGAPTVRYRQEPIRMFLPVRPYRYGRNVPLWRRQQASNGSKLIDWEHRGSLYDWELINRPHTKRNMDIFLTNQNHPDKHMIVGKYS